MATRKTATTSSSKSAGTPAKMVTVCLRSHYDRVFELGDKKILIKGHNASLRGVDGGVLDSGRAFGETIIPEEDWMAIKAKYGTDPNEKLFSGGYIFAAGNKTDARAEAKEKEDLKTGMEPVDTQKTATKEEKKP